MQGRSNRLRFSGRAEWGLAVILFAVTLALFWPARRFDLISLDDFVYVRHNPILADGLVWAGIWRALTTLYEQWWLPLLWISYLLDEALWGSGPQGHHLTNVLLHAANSALLFAVLRRMTGARWCSLFVAALFAWHPTRVEAVAWIAARKDVLSGLFFLLALSAYARYAERPSARGMAWTFAAMLAGLMSKAILVALPPLLLLLDVWPLRRVRWPGAGAGAEWRRLLAEKAPLIALAALFVGINLCTHSTGRGADAPVSALARLGMLAPNVLAYLKLSAAPIRLSLLYPENDVVVWPAALAALAVVLGGLWALWHWRQRYPYVAVGGGWFLVLLLPVLRGVRMGLAQYANRWTYLPLIGLGLALTWATEEWSRDSRRRRWLVAGAGSALLAACLAGTRAELPHWRDSRTVFARAVAVDPTAHFAHNSLGLALIETGRVEEGLAHVETAVRLRPDKAGYAANLGSALLRLGRAKEALAWQDQAIQIRGDQADYHNNRGQALAALDRRDEARTAFGDALHLAPNHPEANFNLGVLLFEAGNAAAALPHFQAAVRSRPRTAAVWYNLGMANAALGRYAEAESCVLRALDLEPGMTGAEAALRRIRLLRF